MKILFPLDHADGDGGQERRDQSRGEGAPESHLHEFEPLLGGQEAGLDHAATQFVGEVLVDIGDRLQEPPGVDLVARGDRHDIRGVGTVFFRHGVHLTRKNFHHGDTETQRKPTAFNRDIQDEQDDKGVRPGIFKPKEEVILNILSIPVKLLLTWDTHSL